MMEEEQKKERIQTKSLKSQTETESSSPRDSRIIKGFKKKNWVQELHVFINQ